MFIVHAHDTQTKVSSILFLCLKYMFSHPRRFSRVGSIILALHEGCDVFLEIAKLSKYCGYELMAGFAFVSFVLSWTVLRLIYFPFWIIWSTRLVRCVEIIYFLCR